MTTTKHSKKAGQRQDKKRQAMRMNEAVRRAATAVRIELSAARFSLS
jgi:hypothetical protein